MRHGKGYNKLSKPTDQRIAMLRSMAIALLRYSSIEITEARAKELRRYVDKILTLVKKGDLQSRRRVIALLLNDKPLVKQLFTNQEKYKARTSGHSRIMRTRLRRGDGAQLVLMEMVDGVRA